MRNDLPLCASTRTNGGTADHTRGISRSLLVAHSPQPRHTNLGTGRTARHKVEQTTWVGHAVQAVELFPSPGREEREALVERYRATCYVPWVGSVACGAAGGRGGGQSSTQYLCGRNVLWVLDLQLNDSQADVESRFVEQTDGVPVCENLLRRILGSASLLCILAISDNAHVHLNNR